MGKHPRSQHGVLDATTDEAAIERWWALWPDANVGIACQPSGLVVLDIDPRHGGDDSLSDLVKRFGREAFDTVTALTGGGGAHLVYQASGAPLGDVANSERFTGPLGPGIDVRARGYIVAPPSLHESGAFYEWECGPDERDPSPLPPEIEEILLPPPISSERASRVNVAETLAGVPEGERDWRLFLLAAKLRGADVPVEWAYRLVGEAAASCTPPFSPTEARRKVESAYRYAAGRTAYEAAQRAEQAGPGSLLDARVLLDQAVLKGVPEPDWAIEPVLVRGQVTMLYGAPESGKTIIALGWMRDLANEGHNVIYFDEESGLVSVASRMAAMGVEAPDDHIYYFPFLDLDVAGFEAALPAIDALRPALVVFDSLTDMLAGAGLDENSGVEVTGWMKGVAIALSQREYAPAVLLIDHITKDAANTAYSVGTRAKKAKTDVQWYVEKRSEFDRLRTATVALRRHKNRPGVLPATVEYTVGGRDGRLVVERQGGVGAACSPEAMRVLAYLKSVTISVTNGEACAAMEDEEGKRPSDETMRRRLKELVDAGLIEATGDRAQRVYRYPHVGIVGERVGMPGEESDTHRRGGGPFRAPPRVGIDPPGGNDREARKEKLRAIERQK